MKLVASMTVAECEPDRYLIPCVASLLEFCDEVVMLLDGDGRWAADRLLGAWGDAGSRVISVTKPSDPVDFMAHEGVARQQLLAATLGREPTHVLAIDADEFVTDGALVRRVAEEDAADVWTFCMQEVWNAEPGRLELRQDGGWEEHDVTALWSVESLPAPHAIVNRALACGRVPEAARRAPAGCTGAAILHFGWANAEERAARHERYEIADGGRFHAKAHLDSILLPDDQLTLGERAWPRGLDAYYPEILTSAHSSIPIRVGA